ncbi:hypothetical protein [Bosea sp. PAMC 26642]|uniref:hypothetical protein n=1 Tax=Bosea sp. (strain PAMC 26642) TaxID=1792307 RepID=UPI0012E97D86|nr:hypothetical protein [Bosea sp. PAMC 26642]
MQPGFTTRYRPGILVHAYVAACGDISSPDFGTGLLGAARDLQMPLYKVASTKCADPRRRIDGLNRDRYGVRRQLKEGSVSDLGFNTWALQQISPNRSPLAGAPIKLEARSISVILPAGLENHQFEKRLHVAMKNASLNSWLASPAGQTHCRMLGLDPGNHQRFSDYRFGQPTRLSPSDEIYIFRPIGEDADRLLMIIETIIQQWVIGTAPRAPTNWTSRSQHAARRSGAFAHPI